MNNPLNKIAIAFVASLMILLGGCASETQDGAPDTGIENATPAYSGVCASYLPGKDEGYEVKDEKKINTIVTAYNSPAEFRIQSHKIDRDHTVLKIESVGAGTLAAAVIQRDDGDPLCFSIREVGGARLATLPLDEVSSGDNITLHSTVGTRSSNPSTPAIKPTATPRPVFKELRPSSVKITSSKPKVEKGESRFKGIFPAGTTYKDTEKVGVLQTGTFPQIKYTISAENIGAPGDDTYGYTVITAPKGYVIVGGTVVDISTRVHYFTNPSSSTSITLSERPFNDPQPGFDTLGEGATFELVLTKVG